MIFKLLNKPLTLKGALQILAGLAACVALVFALSAAYNWLNSAPPSPKSVKKSIRSYLKKQTHLSNFEADYDLRLKDKVSDMQTNVVKLRETVGTLQTNLANLRSQNAVLRRDVGTHQNQTHSLKQQVQNQEADIADKRKRIAARELELANAQTNLLRSETNWLAATNALQQLYANVLQVTNELIQLQTNLALFQAEAAVLQTNLVSLQADAKARSGDLESVKGQIAEQQKNIASTKDKIQTTQQQLVSLRGKLRDQGNDLAGRLTRFTGARTTASIAQTQLSVAQSNLLAAQTILDTKRASLEAKQKELTAKTTALQAGQKDAADCQAELEAKQKDLAALQRDLLNKQQLLTRQYIVYAQDVRKKVSEAMSYEAIYRLVGQQLWLADRFLDGKEPDRHRDAIRLAMDASQHAGQAAENHWLAARICEAYLWPNVSLTNTNGTPLYPPEDLLQACGGAFQRAGETDHLIKNYHLTLDHLTNNVRADAVRYYLASTYEQADQLDQAAKYYRLVNTNTNYLRYAEQRLAVVENKIKALKPAK